MIAIGASALMAVLPDEPEAAAGAEKAGFVDGLQLEIAAVSLAVARRVAGACARWGKGVHPAGLNSGGCVAHEVAGTRGRPLLHVGADFARTNIASVP